MSASPLKHFDVDIYTKSKEDVLRLYLKELIQKGENVRNLKYKEVLEQTGLALGTISKYYKKIINELYREE